MRTLSSSTTAKLFATGFTVGPVVDSLHNQCLLRYDFLPISLEWPAAFHQNQNAFADIAVSGSSTMDFMGEKVIGNYPYFFCSSWIVPPLLGFAYVVLGGLLPRLVESIVEYLGNKNVKENSSTELSLEQSWSSSSSSQRLRTRALLAVTSTATIIKLSEFLETNPELFDNFGILRNHFEPASLSLMAMVVATISQWSILDGSIVTLLVGMMTAVGGPLAELPFVGHGVWTYVEEAADYYPLRNVFSDAMTHASAIDSDSLRLEALSTLFGTNNFQDLALSSITGPCYFAVATDAIALGRWFDASAPESEDTNM